MTTTDSGTLLTLAYPVFAEEAAGFIEALRHQHDPRCQDVPPHFTMVFATSGIPKRRYQRHVEVISERTHAIDFRCRYAMLGAGDGDDNAYVFLAPDEGYAALSLLHDALYQGILEPHLRLDLLYVPHITVGVMQDRLSAKRLCDELNASGIDISGRVEALTVASVAGSDVQGIATFPLRREPGG